MTENTTNNNVNNNLQFINCTPHDIVLNNGMIIKASGIIARVSNKFSEFDNKLCCNVSYGDIENLPAPEEGKVYIVSAMVLSATNRKDVVAPATGHPECIRDKGLIVSVPGFVYNGNEGTDVDKLQIFYHKMVEFLREYNAIPNGTLRIELYNSTVNAKYISFVDYSMWIVDCDDLPVSYYAKYNRDMALNIYKTLLNYIDEANCYNGGNCAPIMRLVRIFEEYFL